MITITDTVGTCGTTTCEESEVADTLRKWFPWSDAEIPEVLVALQDLEDALCRERYPEISGLCTFLGIEVDW